MSKNNKKADLSLKEYGIISLIISILAIGIAIGVLCISYPRNQNTLDFDYLGLIVGLLSFLVTMLLGWQLVNLVAARGRIERIENIANQALDEVKNMEIKLDKSLKYSRALAFSTELTTELRLSKPDFDGLKDIYLGLAESLGLFMASGDTKYPSFCLVNMDVILTDLQNFKPTTEQVKKFDALCDNMYDSIKSDFRELTGGDLELLHDIRSRRKTIFTESPLKSPVNPVGIKLKPR